MDKKDGPRLVKKSSSSLATLEAHLISVCFKKYQIIGANL